jgi:hypothetical protein
MICLNRNHKKLEKVFHNYQVAFANIDKKKIEIVYLDNYKINHVANVKGWFIKYPGERISLLELSRRQVFESFQDALIFIGKQNG